MASIAAVVPVSDWIVPLGHPLVICPRSETRVTGDSLGEKAWKNSPSVTCKAEQICCKELIEGEACPFSTCDMKLGENPDIVASALTEIPCCSRSFRTVSPTLTSVLREKP